MISTELIGGPYDGRVVSIPEYVDEILFPNMIPLDILYVEHAFNPDTFEPPMFTNSSYKANTNMKDMTIDYIYAGVKK